MTPYITKTRLLDLESLSVDDICIEDIAHSLARQIRFNGHTDQPYTVAQHSVICGLKAPVEHSLAALLHDAHEYIIGDIPSPVIQWLGKSYCMDINVLKYYIDGFIECKFGVDLIGNHIVHAIDKDVTLMELSVLFNGKENELIGRVWSAEEAEHHFIYWFEQWRR